MTPWHWVDCPSCGAVTPHHRTTYARTVDCSWCPAADIATVPGTYQEQARAELYDRAKRLDLLVAIIRYHAPPWAAHVLSVVGVSSEEP